MEPIFFFQIIQLFHYSLNYEVPVSTTDINSNTLKEETPYQYDMLEATDNHKMRWEDTVLYSCKIQEKK